MQGALMIEHYKGALKQSARILRSHMTDAEQLLWQHLRRKQLYDLHFYRQKPLLNYIVDFYCPAVKLVVELDGSQHAEADHHARDTQREADLAELGLKVLRFDDRQVLLETDAVLEAIGACVKERL